MRFERREIEISGKRKLYLYTFPEEPEEPIPAHEAQEESHNTGSKDD